MSGATEINRILGQLSSYRKGILLLTFTNLLLACGIWFWTGGGTWMWLLGSTPLWAVLLLGQVAIWKKYGQMQKWDDLHEAISKIRIISLISTLGGVIIALCSISEIIHLTNLGVYLAANGSVLLILILKLQWEVGLVTDKM